MFEGSTDLIDPRSSFRFQEQNGRRSESLCWRIFARSDTAVHQFGLGTVSAMNVRRAERGQTPSIYRGFLQGITGSLRQVVTSRGHRVMITHEPLEGCQHAEITIVPSQANIWEKNDQREVADEVYQLMSTAHADYQPQA
jgi:hypothetical protein